jgi:sec-independent protein translocase protein TatB
MVYYLIEVDAPYRHHATRTESPHMLGMGPMEIAVILIVALIIFGPGKLPEIGQTIGRAVRDFRSATQDITGDFQRTMNEFQETADDFKTTAMELQHEAESTISGAHHEIESGFKDFEKATQDASSEVNEGLQLDQVDSEATRPSAAAAARMAESKPAEEKASSRTSKSKAASSKKKAQTSKSKAKSAASSKKKASKTNGKAAASKSKKTDGKAEKSTRKRRTPAAVSTSSAPSKEDPLADLMGVEDTPLTSRSSRTNGRSRS